MTRRLMLHCFVGLAAVVATFQFPSIGRAGRLFQNAAVGGISIDADGVVGQPSQEAMGRIREHVEAAVTGGREGIVATAQLRKVSLSGLEAAITDALQNGTGVIPEEVKYLAGIQRIQYVLAYPESGDIVLAGPGEGWRVDDTGVVVGVTTGIPVVQLDDLMVALRSARSARDVGITCSIDPKKSGLQKLQTLLRKQKTFHPSLVGSIERALGPQDVNVTGIPADTHFQRVLVACDYRMKRIAMNLEESPLKSLPGFLDLVKQKRGGALHTMTPRWWLACNYDPLARSEDGLAWELRGPGVKAMTEQDYLAADGSVVRGGGKASPLAQQWADLMTENYEELAKADPVFGQLRNLMDLCVVAALIEREQLMSRAACSLPLLTDLDSDLMTDVWNPAKTVDTQCSFIKKGRNYIITASGGVNIESWRVIEKTTTDASVNQTREKSARAAKSGWWWN